MLAVVNYADKKFKNSQILNGKTAKKFGADKVFSYSREDIDEEFMEKNKEQLAEQFGGGNFVWKPYFIERALRQIEMGDYLMYCDSGAIFVDKISHLINCMEEHNTDIMLFSLEKERLEKYWTKRDTFVNLECDSPEYTDTPQILAGYLVLKKTKNSVAFIDEWLSYAQDVQINLPKENKCGLPDYDGFTAGRTQGVISLMAKKKGIKPFRDPSQFGEEKEYPKDIADRSTYPQIIDSTRMKNTKYMWQVFFMRNYVYKVRHKIWLTFGI